MEKENVKNLIKKYRDDFFIFIDLELIDGHTISLNHKNNFKFSDEFLYVYGIGYKMEIGYSAIKNISI